MAVAFKPCSVPGCNGNAHYAAGGVRGFCRAHYRRLYRYGSPTAGQTYKGEPEQALRAALSHTGDACFPWPFAKDARGYGQLSFDGRVEYAHRLVCRIAHGEPPEPSSQAAHSCGRGHLGCASPHHLRWASATDNAADKVQHGTLPLGERHHGALLTEDDVREIRRLRGVMTQKELGERYGVHKETIGSVQRRANWGWLT